MKIANTLRIVIASAHRENFIRNAVYKDAAPPMFRNRMLRMSVVPDFFTLNPTGLKKRYIGAAMQLTIRCNEGNLGENRRTL